MYLRRRRINQSSLIKDGGGKDKKDYAENQAYGIMDEAKVKHEQR